MEEEENKSKKKIVAFLCGKTGLLVLVILYTLFGALIFKALEGGTEVGIPQDIQRSREDCLRELWLITERLNVLYEKNWTKLVTEQLKRFEKVVVESGNNVPKQVEDHWTFGGALLYTLTLLTTVGYGKLSPRTALGKVIAMIYALIGVPLMLVLLSLLGSMLANGAKIAYSKIQCKEKKKSVNTVVGFHKGSSITTGKNKSEDCTIQILPHNSQNTMNYKSQYAQDYHVDHSDVPKKAILATVRASHARGRCRQGQVRQMLADPHFCPSAHHGATSRSIAGSLTSDVEETEENEDSEHGLNRVCVHDTPSRVPLICRPNEPAPVPPSQPSQEPPPPVPAILVLAFFSSYVCLGASVFATTRGWNFLDAAYFCFAALSTIGVFDVLPTSSDIQAQLQLVACCLYLFLGLIVVAMCFTLVQDEVTYRCRRLAKGLGFG